MDVRSASSNFGKAVVSGLKSGIMRVYSHCPAKFCTRALAFGSCNMRGICVCWTLMSLNEPGAAAVNRASSGIVLQRKYDSRDAIS